MSYGNQALLVILYFICTLFCGLKQGEILETGRQQEDVSQELSFTLQCSCLENPRDGGAWWAAFYGVAQSRTRLKQLSSSSSSKVFLKYFFPIMVYHRILNIVLCAIQQILVGYPFSIQQCVHVHPKLPNYPFPPFLPQATISSFSKSLRLFLFCK